MVSVPIELPDDYREAAERRRSALGLDDVSAYIRKLIAADVEVERDQRLAELARERLDGGQAVELAPEEFRKRLMDRLRDRFPDHDFEEAAATRREFA